MIHSKKILILVLSFPILILASVVIYKNHLLSSSQEVILPISGYDPRDILSGHYLIYQVDYPVNDVCATVKTVEHGYVCLEPKTFSQQPPPRCKILISGVCQHQRFFAGIEKFYIPEDKAEYLDKQIRSKSASIVISVSSSGHAMVKNLLINGKPWDSQ